MSVDYYEYKSGKYTIREHNDGTKQWFIDAKFHREDGPACEYADGTKSWYIQGERHREDSPAIERADGDKYWYIEGELHREDGPAIEYADGSKFWYVQGELVYDEDENHLSDYKGKLSETFKKSVIRYELQRK